MSDPPGQPPADDEGTAKDPEFRDDALSELMTGALAATSMVAMGVNEGDEGVPAPPVWAPTAEPPRAEVLDIASGVPAHIQSGRHSAIEPEVELDADLEVHVETDAAPLGADALQPRASDAVTVPLFSPHSVVRLGPPSVDVPVSSEDYPALSVYADDESEGAASISTDSGVIVTSQHAEGARLTGAYPAVSSQRRSPSPKREKSSMPWLIGGAVLLGLIAVGAVVMVTIRDTNEPPSVASQGQGEHRPEADPAAVDPDPVPAPEPVPDPVPEPEPVPEPIDSAPDAPVAPEEPEPEPEPAAPEAPPPSDSATVYAAALTRYEADPTNPALLDLTLIACRHGLGPDARLAFRKLVGGKARSEAVIKCRAAGVDVSSKVDGYTGPEIAAQARTALEAGNANEALDLAKLSNRTQRNYAALALMVQAHCELKQKKAAKKLLRHVPEKRRPALVRDCAKRGVRLPK